MKTELHDELASAVLGCAWPALEPHHKRGGLLLVRQDLDLIEAAVAVANDRADRIEVWTAIGRLGRPKEVTIKELNERSPRFQFVIVQPWVLAQELPD